MSTHLLLFAAFAVYLGTIVAILVADLALGRMMRGLPYRALFIAVHVALIVAYLALGSMLVIGPVLPALPTALVAFLVAYLALGMAQVAAIMAGLKEGGTVGAGAVLVGLLLGYLPIIGGIAAVRGAAVGWRWTTARGLARFLGPLAAIAVPLLFG
jgi:hypothetical protein